MMVCLCNSLSSATLSPHLISTAYVPPPLLPAHFHTIGSSLQSDHRKTKRRGISVVTRAAPTTVSYVFAFVFPFSLLAVTIFTSIRVADKLDQKFFEELSVDLAILEGEEDDNKEEIPSSSKREPAPIRTRNRPKREVESSSI